jgi:hypothetical protein
MVDLKSRCSIDRLVISDFPEIGPRSAAPSSSALHSIRSRLKEILDRRDAEDREFSKEEGQSLDLALRCLETGLRSQETSVADALLLVATKVMDAHDTIHGSIARSSEQSAIKDAVIPH